jgi:hypothetical protein
MNGREYPFPSWGTHGPTGPTGKAPPIGDRQAGLASIPLQSYPLASSSTVETGRSKEGWGRSHVIRHGRMGPCFRGAQS